MEMGCFTGKGSARYCHVDMGLTVTRQPAGLRKAIDIMSVCCSAAPRAGRGQ